MKRYAVVFSSQTGNTAEIAGAMQRALSKEECVAFGGSEENQIDEADVVFVGFWTDRGNCSADIEKFLLRLNHKQVVLFGTAGFGMQQQYFETILQKVKEKVPDTCRILGGWMCQGKMPAVVEKSTRTL